MKLLDQTRLHQHALADYCRTGDYQHIPGVRTQHVHHYRRLVYNVVDDSLRSSYPLTFQLLDTDTWDILVQHFFSSHHCQSPQVWYMPGEFLTWFRNQHTPLKSQYPFLEELLHFEWLEVEVYMMEDIPQPPHTAGNLLTDQLVLNPEHHLQYFTYPVHLKQAYNISEADKGHYFLCLHRHPENGEVLFNDCSPAFIHMLELLAEQPLTQSDLVHHTCELLQLTASAEIHQATAAFFTQAAAQQLLLGVSVNP